TALTSAACPNANRRALTPATGSLSTNTNLVGTFVPGTGNLNDGLALGTDPNSPKGFRITKPIDFEPRLGFAYDLFGKGKTVLRAMGGVYHSPRVGGGTTGGNLGDNFLRPYRGFGDITMTMWDANSSYNGLQVQVNRRYTRGFQYGVAYTYSKTLDYGKDDDSSDVSLGRPYKPFNYGPADFDQTHIFTVNYIWDLPNLSPHWNNRVVRADFDH